MDRFKNETAPDVAGMAAKSGVPCYGVALGDIGRKTTRSDYDKSNVMHLYHCTLKNADASVEARFICRTNVGKFPEPN